MTKIWCPASIEEEYTEVQIHRSEEFEPGFSPFSCMPVPGRFPETTLEVIWDHPPADFFDPGSLFTVSDRLKSALEEFNPRVEFFPVRVIYQGTAYTECTFYFCNILDCVDCLDLARGEYTFETKPGFTHMVHQIQKLAIDEKKAAGHDLFRIANGGECNVCVSERVASRIVERKLTGVRFVSPEDWRFGIAVG